MSGVELSEVELSLRCEKWGRPRFAPVWSEAGGGGRGDLGAILTRFETFLEGKIVDFPDVVQ